MLANPKEIFKDAEKHNYAIAGFNTPTLEGLLAVVEAAEELDAPVMITHAQAHEPFAPIDVFGPLMMETARRARAPVIVHLDHGMDYSYVIRAIRCGFTSVMYDCSQLPFEENAERVGALVKVAHELGITVEAEIGRMPSNVVGQGGCTEYGRPVEHIEDYFTVPGEAAAFCERTGVDLLAVSFGSVHGVYVEHPRLDLERLGQIHRLTRASLVMHGTSGVDDAQVIAAINGGIRKFNYYTGVATSPIGAVAEQIRGAEGPLYYHEITRRSREIMREKALSVIRLMRNGR